MKLFGSDNCFFCGKPTHPLKRSRLITKAARRRIATQEHLVPKSRLGSFNESNIVTACAECNVEKANLTLEEFRLVRAYQMGLIAETDAIKFAGEAANPTRFKFTAEMFEDATPQVLIASNLR